MADHVVRMPNVARPLRTRTQEPDSGQPSGQPNRVSPVLRHLVRFLALGCARGLSVLPIVPWTILISDANALAFAGPKRAQSAGPACSYFLNAPVNDFASRRPDGTTSAYHSCVRSPRANLKRVAGNRG